MGIVVFIGAFILGYFIFLTSAYLLAQLLFHKIDAEEGDDMISKKSHALKVHSLRAGLSRKTRMRYALK
jgi:hypothetical protein